MKVRSKTRHADRVSFRAFVGDGHYNDLPFELSVTCGPDGTLLGMPLFVFGDPDRTEVTFELADLLPLAVEAAGLEVTDA